MTAKLNINQKLIKLRPVIIVFLVLITGLLICTPAFASLVSAFQTLATNMLTSILTGTLENPVLEYFIDPIYDASAHPEFQTTWTLVKYVYDNVIKPLAIAVVGLAFVVKIVQMTMDLQQVTPERFITPFIYLAGAVLLIDQGYMIMMYIIELGSVLADGIQTYASAILTSDVDTIISQLVPDFENESGWQGAAFLQALLLCAELMLPYIAWWLGNMLMKITCWGIILELVVRCMVFPLFVSDFMFHGFEGQAMKQVKNLCGVASSGAIVIAISGVQSTLVAGILQNVIDESANASGTTALAIEGIGQIIVIMFACIVLMGKATSIAREAWGA